MVDRVQMSSTECCLCGDIGFPDKLFRCQNCSNRFQHSYCSNYYSKSSEPIEVCDWCQSEQKSSRNNVTSSKKAMAKNGLTINKRSEYSGEKIKHREEGSDQKGKSASPSTGAPSPRTVTRRYKLLKDVTC